MEVIDWGQELPEGFENLYIHQSLIVWRGIPMRVMKAHSEKSDWLKLKSSRGWNPAGQYCKVTALRAVEEKWRESADQVTESQRLSIESKLNRLKADDAQRSFIFPIRKRFAGQWFMIFGADSDAQVGETVMWLPLRRMLPEYYQLTREIEQDLVGRRYFTARQVDK